jgi:transposase
MARQRRSYTSEFKVEAVKLVTEKGYSVAEAARSLGIGENLLRNWKQALEEGGDQAFPGKGNLPAIEEELRQLRAENKRLLMERDILKKALRVFEWVTFGLGSQGNPVFSKKSALSFRGKSCHAVPMAKFKQLHDLYRFPGFVPQARIRGVFGDPSAVVLTLRRRRKKRFAAAAGKRMGPTTTSGPGVPGISPVATSVSTSLTSCAGSSAHGAGA